MKTAFAHWNRRIAPVFDTARQVLIVETDSGQLCGRDPQPLPDGPIFSKVLRLVALGVQTLVCGAISRSMQELITAYGIRVVPFVAGDLETVIQAWLRGNLMLDTFAMPGCRSGGRRRFRRMHEPDPEGNDMVGRGRGLKAGSRNRQGRGGQRPGHLGGAAAAGPSGYCVCPQCGRRLPHQRGTPCVERHCPNCRIAMTRQSI
jgi:predicted Fe-Mo cluster-binding NifX family protein